MLFFKFEVEVEVSLRSLHLKCVAVFIIFQMVIYRFPTNGDFDSWVLSSKRRTVKQYVDWISDFASDFADYCQRREGLRTHTYVEKSMRTKVTYVSFVLLFQLLFLIISCSQKRISDLLNLFGSEKREVYSAAIGESSTSSQQFRNFIQCSCQGGQLCN